MFGRRSGFLLGQTAYFSGAFAVSFRECIWTSSLTQYWLDSPSSLPPSKSDPWHFPSLSARFYRRMLQECNLIKSVFHVSLYNRNATQLPLPNWVKCFFFNISPWTLWMCFLKDGGFLLKKIHGNFQGIIQYASGYVPPFWIHLLSPFWFSVPSGSVLQPKWYAPDV